MISSWNVNGLRRITESKDNELTDYIKKYKPDLLFLQETKIEKDEDEVKFANYFDGYKGYFNSLSYNSAGVAVLIKDKFVSDLESNDIKLELSTLKKELVFNKDIFKGRIITLEFPNFYIINTYVLHSGSELEKLEQRAIWDEQMTSYLQHLRKDKPLIWCGDLNVANQDIDLAHPAANKNKTAGFTDQERDAFKKILVMADLIDVFRYANPLEHKYSFWSWLRKENRTKNVGWRLDYMNVSRKYQELLDNENIYSVINTEVMGSDHCPVELHFDWS
jgi:exodeoxyribonuclease III